MCHCDGLTYGIIPSKYEVWGKGNLRWNMNYGKCVCAICFQWTQLMYMDKEGLRWTIKDNDGHRWTKKNTDKRKTQIGTQTCNTQTFSANPYRCTLVY